MEAGPALGSADFTGSVWGDVNAKGIEAKGAVFEDMRFLDTLPKAVKGELGDDKPVTFRVKHACPPVRFEKADLRNTRWKGTELTQVTADKELLSADKIKAAISLNKANISGADFSEASVYKDNLSLQVDRILNHTISDQIIQILKSTFAGARYDPSNIPKLTSRKLSRKNQRILFDSLSIRKD
jgi:hypothetical protein